MIYELMKWSVSTIDWCREKTCVERSSSLSYIQETKNRLEENDKNIKLTIESKQEESSPYRDWRDIYG